MNMKFLGAVAALAIGFTSEAAFADDAPAPEFTITGAAAIVSQYKFRGLTQSDSKPTVQATFTVSDKSGFYISMWGSGGAGNRNVNADGSLASYDFYFTPNGGTEIDVYGGYTHALGKSGVTFDAGLYGYIYPNLTANNIFEVYGDLSKSYGPITAKVGLNWAPKQHYFNFYNTATKYSMYEYGELSFSPVKEPALTFHSHLGHTGGGLNFVKEYLDYTAGISYKWKSLTFDISAVGTNISRSDVANAGLGAVGSTLNNSTYRYGKLAPVGSITASF
ncbi:MAG: TorF family putative porin [Pseudomonadota bacterium]|nr:TorF family putative porin [Pseudomonadota bacterium]